MKPLVYFVRHGQTDWNAERRLQGQADTDINETGRRQADRNGRRLAELIADPGSFDFVASPMRRTRETMERIRAGMGLDPQAYRTDTRLVELHFGDWQGQTMREVELATPGAELERERDKWHFVPPGSDAESYEMLSRRVAPWLEAIDRPTVCVTHGGIIRSVFRLVGGYSAQQASAMDVRQDRLVRMENGLLEWL